MAKSLFETLGFLVPDREGIKKFGRKSGIKLSKLDYYNQNHILPESDDLNKISEYSGLSKVSVMLQMGILDAQLLDLISDNADMLEAQILPATRQEKKGKITLELETDLGKLYKGDCLDLLKEIPDNSVDLVFADPPFNLNKFYLSDIDDNLSGQDYLNWCYQWIDECIRVVKEGGSLFIWNIPKWNTFLSKYLNDRLYFRHWVAADIKFSLPISGRLYPSHYSLLYYTKGNKVNVFHPDRLPMETCPKCFKELKDYGGYKDKMNPLGVNITDVWYDIPPVRHKKYKNRDEANELSVKLLDRVIEMATNPGDLVFDPFGGAGTTYVVAEIKQRRWIGVELGPVQDIVERFKNINDDEKLILKYRANYNQLFPKHIKARRQQLDLWTDESFQRNGKSVELTESKN